MSNDGGTTTTRVVEKLNGPLEQRSQAGPRGVTGASDAMHLALIGTGAIILLVAFFADRVQEFSGPGFTVGLSQPEVAELSTMVHERAKEEGINEPRALGRVLADALALAERERAAGREPDWDAIARKATPSNARSRALSSDAYSQWRLYRAASDEDRKRAAYIGAAGRSPDGGEALWVQYQGAAGEFSPIANAIDWRTAEGQRETALAIANHALGGRHERLPTQADIDRLTDLISEVSPQGPGWSIPRSKAEELLGGLVPGDP